MRLTGSERGGGEGQLVNPNSFPGPSPPELTTVETELSTLRTPGRRQKAPDAGLGQELAETDTAAATTHEQNFPPRVSEKLRGPTFGGQK